MKTPEYDPEKMTDLFKAVHEMKSAPQVGPDWSFRTMVRIRGLAAETQAGFAPDGITAFFQLVWRLSPAALCLAGILAVCMLRIGVFPDTELLALLYDASETQTYLF